MANTSKKFEVLVLIALILLAGGKLIEAGGNRDLMEGIISHDIVLIGQLKKVQMGTISNPGLRMGQLETIQVFKGNLPPDTVDILLPSNWGPPTLVSRLGTYSFWAFAVFLVCGAITISRHKKAKNKEKNKKIIVMFSVLMAMALLNMFMTSQEFSSAVIRSSPLSLINEPMIWTISKDQDHYRGSMNTIGSLETRQYDKDPILEKVAPDTRQCILSMYRYLAEK